MLLEKLQYSSECAFSGEECLMKLKKKEPKFNAVLLDSNMPIMNGFETAKAIKDLIKNKQLIEIPIILLTGDVVSLSKNELKELGIQYVLQKPISKNYLGKALSSIFSIK